MVPMQCGFKRVHSTGVADLELDWSWNRTVIRRIKFERTTFCTLRHGLPEVARGAGPIS